MHLREAGAEDVDEVCALLEAAFGRPDEARLYRALTGGDELALALVAIGAPAQADPGATVGAGGDGAAARRPSPSRRGRAASRAGDADDGDDGDAVDARITGVAVLSHLLSPQGAVALGPLAVRPDCSDRGIGKALIAECVARAREAGHTGVFVLGQPPYYARAGFSVEAARPFRSEYPAEFMLALELQEGALAEGGELRYPPAFAGL